MSPSHLLPLALVVARSWRALVVHLPGYGRSPAPAVYTLTASHEAVEEALAERKCHACHLVGIGAGGYRALALAVRGAFEVRSVAVLGGGADYTPEEARRLESFARSVRLDRDVATELVDLVLSPRGREHRDWVDDVRCWSRATSRENLARELEAVASASDLRPPLARLDAPVLVRTGSIDAASVPERSRRMLGALRHATYEVVPGVGHSLLHEDFAATSESILRHLARTTSAP